MITLWAIWSAALLLGFVANGDKGMFSSDDLPQPSVRGVHLQEELIKEKQKEDDAHARTFPIIDEFKTSQLYSNADLKDSVEFEHKRDNIAEAVENALENLHNKEQEKKQQDNAKSKQNTKHIVRTKDLVDEIVKQQLKASGNADSDAKGNKENNNAKPKEHVELEKQIQEKLGEISKLETKLFVLVRDIKGFLLEKKKDESSRSAMGENDFNVPLSTLMEIGDGTKRTLPSVPSLAELRRNPQLVDHIIDKALDGESNEKYEDGTAQGHTRNILTDHASLEEFAKGPLEDMPLSKLYEESDESDTLASDRDISRDGLVESPLSSQDYKKTLGKKFRHAVN